MFKKIINMFVIFIALFYFSLNNIYAYEFSDKENENGVKQIIREIYDSKEQYEDLVGGYNKTVINFVSNNKFWWPIGSMETEEKNGKIYAPGEPAVTTITSYYGGDDGFRTSLHGGVDIGNGGNGPGVINIIAAKAGEVVYPLSEEQTKYDDNGYYGNTDGGGFGNYVKIKHSDGTYTIYAHLAKDSILVKSGDVVDQGQVIGKMGTSGSSTGVHLHFEVRIGSDSAESRVNPLDYIDPENPRPLSFGSGDSFSLTTTTLSKEEFKTLMLNYYNRTGKKGFYNNFALKSDEIYDASIANNINPELVVVTAGTEQNWTLSSACQYTNNYWGLGTPNGANCHQGSKFRSISEGIAAYAKALSKFTETGSKAPMIKSRYELRASAGCDPSGHGLPGTFVGMQSIYSWIGNYRYNPGSAGLGGCYYLNILYGKNYCSTVPTCVGNSNCAASSKTTTCEQNDYTAWQVEKKFKMRYDIFGL